MGQNDQNGHFLGLLLGADGKEQSGTVQQLGKDGGAIIKPRPTTPLGLSFSHIYTFYLSLKKH